MNFSSRGSKMAQVFPLFDKHHRKGSKGIIAARGKKLLPTKKQSGKASLPFSLAVAITFSSEIINPFSVPFLWQLLL